MKNLQTFALILILLSFASCSQKNKNNQDGSFNDTLAVRDLLVQEIRKDLDNKPDIDSIKGWWNGMQWVISYRIDKEFWNSQSISMILGDINGDGLNDAIAKIEFDTGGNRPWKDWTELYIERTADGYKVKGNLPLFEYRYVGAASIKDGLIELIGYNWTENDPMCCPSIKDEFKIKLVGETFVKVVENIGYTADPNAAEFEKAKQVADSIKQKFELEKHGLLKISYTEINEGGTSWICYFNSLFKLNCLKKEINYDENVKTITYEFYNPEGIVLWYLTDQQGNNSNISIRYNHHIYQKVFDSEKNVFNLSINEGEVGETFAFKDQQVAHKLMTTEDNTQVQITAKLSAIPKEEFAYDSDSVCYRLTVQKGEKGEFDSFWSELRVDSLLFIHLFGDK